MFPHVRLEFWHTADYFFGLKCVLDIEFWTQLFLGILRYFFDAILEESSELLKLQEMVDG